MSDAAAGPPAFVLRRAQPGDADALSLLGQATFLETFAGLLDGDDILRHCASGHAAEVYRDWLADAAVSIWLAVVAPGGAPVGYLVMAPSQLPVDARRGDLEIKRIYLLHRFQGTGIGRALLEAATGQARHHGDGRVLLGVYAGNERAIAFYQRAGFRGVGHRRFSIGGGEYDDVVLALDMETAQ
ncbi:MAG: GNAT family N-acetyltransferase [Luteimonas sp.]|nr:GNAT family N-acetyltransferase [Luteimonas sp.]